MSQVPAIILARSGSKGCPDKNKRPIAGRMCFEWSVLDAQAAGCRVIVSSDDQDIIERAVVMGCEIVLRPSELANDTATVQDAVRHACHAKGLDGPVVVLYGCVPVRPKHLISAALAVLESTGADSVQSYCPVGKCHPWWMSVLEKDGVPIDFVELGHDSMATPSRVRSHRRQDLMPLFIPDGGVIVIRDPGTEWRHNETMSAKAGVDVFARNFNMFGAVRQSITTRPGDVIDVDTEHDAMVAECVLRARRGVTVINVDSEPTGKVRFAVKEHA